MVAPFTTSYAIIVRWMAEQPQPNRRWRNIPISLKTLQSQCARVIWKIVANSATLRLGQLETEAHFGICVPDCRAFHRCLLRRGIRRRSGGTPRSVATLWSCRCLSIWMRVIIVVLEATLGGARWNSRLLSMLGRFFLDRAVHSFSSCFLSHWLRKLE